MQKKLMKIGKMLLLMLVSVGLLLPVQASAAEYQCTASVPVEVRQEGSDIPGGNEYTVKIRALDGAPMPMGQDEEGNHVVVDSVRITDAGKAEIGPITYTHPGVYRYEVWQEAEAKAHFTYDETVYTVTVSVTNTEDGGLTALVKARKNGEEDKTEIVFVNRYNKPADPANPDDGGNEGGDTDDDPTVVPAAVIPPAQTPSAQTPSDPGTTSQTGGGPQTGDSADIALWLTTAVLGALVIVVMVCRKKRENSLKEG